MNLTVHDSGEGFTEVKTVEIYGFLLMFSGSTDGERTVGAGLLPASCRHAYNKKEGSE